MKVSTIGCKQFGHPEFILEADESVVPDKYVHEMADTIERMVAEGARFSPGETFQIGWMITKVQECNSSELTLTEPDMRAFPIKWVPGITHTLRQKMVQVFMLDSVSLRDQIELPSILQSLVACTRYSGSDFFMTRDTPTNERDSGWFVGCLHQKHDHQDPANLVCISLYEAFLNQQGIHGFVAFPTGMMVVMDTKKGLSILNEEGPFDIVPGSFLDRWFEQERGTQ